MSRRQRLPLVSVIILNYNGAKYIENCVKSVLNSDYPNFEVIVVDNGSTDGSVQFVSAHFGKDSRLKVIQNEKNLGFAEGNNIGAKAAAGEFTVFLNVDTEVDPRWLEELVDLMEADHTIGVAQAKLLLADDRLIFDSAGDFMDYYGFLFFRGGWEKDLGQFDNADEIFSARGAAMIVRRDLFEKIGAFDPTFFMFCEDVDLGWRIWLSGHRVVFAPKAVVYHVSRGILKESQAGKSRYTFTLARARRNSTVMMIKNYDLINLIKRVPVHIFIEMIHLLIKRDFDVLLQMIKLTWQDFTNLNRVWKERLRIQYFVRSRPDIDIMKHMLRTNFAYMTKALLDYMLHGWEYARRAYFSRTYSAMLRVQNRV